MLFLKRPGTELLRPTGSLNLAVFCLLFDFFSLGVWGGRCRGGFCVSSLSLSLSVFCMYGLVKVSCHGQLTSCYRLAGFGLLLKINQQFVQLHTEHLEV